MAAEREISTRLVLQGEKEYRAAVANINQEYKLLQSRLNLVDSQFAGQKNTLAALEAKNKALNDVIANQTAKLKAENDALQGNKASQDAFAKKAEEAKAKLDELNSTTDDATKQTQEYKDKVAALEKEFEKNVAAAEKAANSADKHATNANKVQTSINQLNGELSKNDKYLNEARASADGCAKSIDEMGREAKQTAEETKELGDKGKQGIQAVASALAGAGIARTYQEIAEALNSCITASRDFESAMAGVAKTTNLSGPELAAMGDAIKGVSLEMPVTASGLAGIAQIGAQLGITTDNLLAFSQVMANLGVATNLTSEDAATLLAQFANVTRMDASQYSNLGSAVVALGNNFATSESNIVMMSQRLAASGTLAGLTEPEILALATAMSSVGIEAEAGGTAMTQTLVQMEKAVAGGGESLNQFAEVAGMTASEFATTWQTAPMTAIQSFLQGLSDIEEQGGSATLVLEEMGLSGVRQSGTLKGLSLASDQLTKATTLSNKAWKENTALTKEAETRYATTDSKVKMFNNSVTALQISVGDLLTPALGTLVDTGKDVVSWAADFVEQNEWLGPAIAGVVAALGAMTAGVIAVTVVIPALKAAWVALQGSMGPIGWITLAVGAVAALGVQIASSARDSKESLDALNESAKTTTESVGTTQEDYQKKLDEIDAANETIDTLLGRASELEEKATAGKLDASEWKEWNDILSMLVETVPELSQVIDLQNGKIEGGVTAIKEHIEAWDKMAREEAAVGALTALYQEQSKAQVNLTSAETKYSASYNIWRDKVNQRVSLLQKLADAGVLSKDVIQDMAESGETLDGTIFDASLWNTVDAFNALSGETINASAEAYEYGKAVETSQKALDTATEAVDKTRDALYAQGGAYKEASEGADDLTQLQADAITKFNDLKTQLDTLTTAYTTAYDNALQSINGIVNGFNEIVMPDPKTIEDLIKALNSQNIYLDNYSDNLVEFERLAKEKGSYGTEEYQYLVDYFTSGGTEAASYLNTVVQDNGENWDMLLNQADEIVKKKETWSTIVANMETGFKEKATTIETEMKTLTDNLNQSTAAGANVKATMDAVTGTLETEAATVESLVSRINRALASIGNITYTEYTEGYNTGKSGKSHAAGLPYVPYDNYGANLHEGEMVLTRLQAQAYRAEQYVTYNYPELPAAQPAPVSAGTPIDYDRLGASVAEAMVGFGVYMDREKVGKMVKETVSRSIDEDIRNGRYL